MSSSLDQASLAHLQTWQGRSETLEDVVTAAPLRGLSAALDRADPPPTPGSELPPLWHWLFFLPQVLQSEIGPDGHAQRGGFLPPVPLPRRMWAGGRLQWHQPLRVGDAVKRVSSVQSIQHKTGRTGELLFVVVAHEVFNQHGLCLHEEHDIVYRPAARADDPVIAATPATVRDTSPPVWQHDWVPDEVMLFRYSALTFNGHRIHYDRAYCREVEGYPGLVVHGPLIATLLLDVVRRHTERRVTQLRFKVLRPTFECNDQRALRVSAQLDADGHSLQLWAQDHEGWLTMQAAASLA
jgi:3-methylfumaryl-CoA hydratase